jgi:hypothetical protein
MLRASVFLFFSILIASCSSALKIDPVSSEYRSSKLIYFVEHHGQDKRHLDQTIASELQKIGLNASSGYKSDRPAKFDILVVYEDRWQWDMTNYLIHMRIDLRSPTTNVLLGTGSSYQTSLARKPEDEVIKNIISGMFNK